MAGVVVTDRDRGYKAMTKRWLGLKSRGVAVGIFGQGAADEHEGGVTNLLVAIVHEFGAPAARIPSRSWLRAFVDEKRDEIRRRVRALAVQVAKGKLDQDQALGQLGAWIAGAIQTRIANKIPPPLQDSTVRKRLAKPSRKAAAKRAAAQRAADKRSGADVAATVELTPLIDTGQFRQAITWEVRDA